MRIFGSVESQTVSTFPFLYIIILQRWESFEPPSYPPRGRWTYVLADFFVWNSISNNFYLKLFFDAMRIFGSVEPQTEYTFPFLYIIIFVTKSQWRHHVVCVFVYGQMSTP